MSDETQPQPEAEQDATPADTEHHGGVVGRARADLAAGRAWKARDRLLGHLADTMDPEALELLGEVQYSMGDLPAAGAAWFGTSRRGKDVDAAIEAWRERHADRFDLMWRSLPRKVRDSPGNARVEALRRRAAPSGSGPTGPAGGGTASGAPVKANGGGLDPAVVITVLLGILAVVCAIVGAITLLRWMLPG